jgi:hypothetical protein
VSELGEEAMSIKDQVIQELNGLCETELKQVAEFLAFLKFRARIRAAPSPDETQLAALYADFAEEDRTLAEEGMADYAAGLRKEDAQRASVESYQPLTPPGTHA